MGWDMPWYTITDDFDADFGVDEWHGTNAFYRDDEDRIFRTYFIDTRGDEALGTAWAYLDITALGRQEKWEDSPEGYPQTEPYVWWNLHDEYDEPTVHEAALAALPTHSGARGARGHDPDSARRWHARGGVPAFAGRRRRGPGSGEGVDRRALARQGR